MNQHAKRRASAAATRAAPRVETEVRKPKMAAEAHPQLAPGERSFAVGAERSGTRLDKFLVAEIEAGGETLSRSMMYHNNLFNNLFIGLVRAGEVGGWQWNGSVSAQSGFPFTPQVGIGIEPLVHLT